MIHGSRSNGEFYGESQNYDVHGRAIRAVDRAGLNKRLLDELEKMPNVRFLFNHKLTGADFKKRIAWFERRSNPRTDHAQNPTQTQEKEDKDSDRSPEIEVSFDFMVGADGAHSAVRYHLMKYARMSYQQEYIDTLWCEFHIDPSTTDAQGFKISPNHLHIWPGGKGEFMFIAIPSLDKSFTCTLFLPERHFKRLDNSISTDLVPFFKHNFPGVVPDLITEEELRKQYGENPHLPLISIKCKPHHYNSSVVILGDSAHAMVPFYGQGMNAGLEDVRVLFDFLDKHVAHGKEAAQARAAALEEYTSQRAPDAFAINDLALRNYQEMRSDVTSPLYRARKRIEESASKYMPSLGWATQYSRVSFGNERYSEVEKAVQRQGRVLAAVLTTVLVGLLGKGAWVWWRWEKASGLGRAATKMNAWLTSSAERVGRKWIG